MNKILSYIGKCAVAAGVAGLLLASCDDKPFEMDLPLAVTSHKLELAQTAGSTHILVYSTGSWRAEFGKTVDWASLNKVSGEGNSDLVFTYSANYGLSRTIDLIISKGELKDTILIAQSGSVTSPSLSFRNRAITLLKTSATVSTPLSTNLRYSLSDIEGSIMYLGTEGDTLAVVPLWKDETAATGVDNWISDVAVGVSDVSYKVTSNSAGVPRTAVISLSITDADGNTTATSQTITQGLDDASLVFNNESMSLEGYSGTYTFASSSNNIWAYVNNIKYTSDPSSESSESWISGINLTSDGLNFSVTKNESGQNRTGSITVSYSDESGNTITRTVSVSQKAYPSAISFEEVRGLTPGLLSIKQYIEGYVVSDPTSANIAKNRQRAQFKFDFTENYKTAYVESTDGKYGFMLKFKTTEDNTLERYSKVRIVLDSATLVKEENPERYTITGLTAESVIEAGTPDEFLVPSKKMKVSDLTDADIYTQVTLTDMEILCKDGSYTNCTDGYSIKDAAKGINPKSGTTSPRWDTAPLLMSDPTGNSIYMLTNSYVPWRRDGTGGNNSSVIPQGSGSFKGVVVAEEHVRYGEIGRYQIRAMQEDDIALNENSKFSNTIVEWNWNNKVGDAIPEEGSGELDFHGATIGTTADYNNTLWHDNSGTNQKGLIPNAALKVSRKWWNFTTDTGEYFDVKFSTANITGSNLIFGISWNHGDSNNTTLDAPAHWKLLYSIDGGETFKDVPDCDIIKNKSLVWWSTTSQDSCPGFMDHIRKLPAECFGKAEVIVRVQVADKVTDIKPGTSSSTWATNLGLEKGTLKDKSTSIRIGTLTVRYN